MLGFCAYQAYGADAWRVTPLTFELPRNMRGWLAWLQEDAEQRRARRRVPGEASSSSNSEDEDEESTKSGPASSSRGSSSGPESLWILKTAQHLGRRYRL